MKCSDHILGHSSLTNELRLMQKSSLNVPRSFICNLWRLITSQKFLRGERINRHWLSHINKTLSTVKSISPQVPRQCEWILGALCWVNPYQTISHMTPPQNILERTTCRAENRSQLRDRDGVIWENKRRKGSSFVECAWNGTVVLCSHSQNWTVWSIPAPSSHK